jgi:hypothetical protein
MLRNSASLEIGFWCNFNGIRYQLIGGSLWRMDYLEYETEEGKSSYQKSYWSYTEWILREPITNQMAYLLEDQEGFSLSLPIEATNRVIPTETQGEFVDFFTKNRTYRVIEYGTSTLDEFQGENGFDEPEPQRKKFWLYEDELKHKYSVEVPLNESGSMLHEDREYYKAVPLKYSEVLEAFDENPSIKQRKEAQGVYGFALGLSRLTAWVLFVLFCYSFFSYTEVFKHSINLESGVRLDSLNMLTQADTLVEFFSPEWEIKDANAIYLIETEAFFGAMVPGKNPCDMFVQTAIIDSEAGVVNQMAGEFWEEYGRDSDGAWRETNRYTSMYVRAEKKGKYSAWVSVERMPDMLAWTAKIEVRVYKYMFLWWYMMLCWLFALMVRFIIGSYVKS